MKSLAVLIVGTVLSVVGVMVGAWWAPFVVGIGIGIACARARVAVPIGAFSGFLAGALLLGADQILYGLGSTASSLASILGFGHQSAIPVILACLVGSLLGLTGAWLGSAGRSLLSPRARPNF